MNEYIYICQNVSPADLTRIYWIMKTDSSTSVAVLADRAYSTYEISKTLTEKDAIICINREKKLNVFSKP